jgi:hypothetical protein
MSAGSDASNLGYGKIIPNSNVNSNFINKDNSHYSGGFGSNEIPGLPGLAGAKSNIDAAAGYVPGICLIKGGSKGGSKQLKRKIKNITKIYRMKNKKTLKRNLKKIKRMASASFSRMESRQRSNIDRYRSVARFGGNKHSTRNKKKIRSMKMKRGGKKYLMGGSYPQSIPYPPGYGQYQNNLPLTPTYSVGGVLSSNQLALANPPPISVLSNCTNCVDNYNHYTNQGFASRGH